MTNRRGFAAGQRGGLWIVPNSRTLVREARERSGPALPAEERPGSRASLAAGTVFLATALTLLGAPAAEALGLI
ncbi:MAG: hypothetical protein JHD16_14850 [Solirubrobacteraceae bacterium]|nr:hypothetical protein [Solirubrobacteraceae bacterium]